MSRPGDPRREAAERVAAAGPRGERGETGARGARGLSLLQGRAVVVLFLIAVGLAAWAAFWVGHVQNGQQEQARMTQQRICTTLGTLAALQPPPGDPQHNPSRAFDQQLHATLAQLGPDFGCGR